jgi:hypothetical protein
MSITEKNIGRLNIKDLKKYQTDMKGILHICLSDFLSYCPSGILLTYNKSRYWLSHGGFPFEFNNIKNLKNTMNEVNIFLKESNNKVIYINNPIISHNIRWADFTNDANSNFSTFNKSGRVQKETSGRVQIGILQLLTFLNTNDIQFIIRGHQDNYHNAYILSENDDFSLNDKKIQEDNPENKYIIFPKKDQKVIGPIAQIKTNNWIQNLKEIKIKYENYQSIIIESKLFPVLTISTNSDLDRTLNKDSFIILKNSLQSDEEFNVKKAKNIVNKIKKNKQIKKSKKNNNN